MPANSWRRLWSAMRLLPLMMRFSWIVSSASLWSLRLCLLHLGYISSSWRELWDQGEGLSRRGRGQELKKTSLRWQFFLGSLWSSRHRQNTHLRLLRYFAHLQARSLWTASRGRHRWCHGEISCHRSRPMRFLYAV